MRHEENFDRLKSILAASFLLELPGLTRFCWSEVIRTLKSDSFLEQWCAAEEYGNVEASNQIVKFVAEHLQAAARSREFLKLDRDQLKKLFLLREPNGDGASTDWVMQAILEWIKYDEEDRKCELVLLLALVDIDSLSGSYLAHILNCETLLTEEDINFNQLFGLATNRLVDMGKKYSDRKLFACVGKKNGSNIMVLYDFDKNAWSAPSLLPMSITSGAAVVAFGGWIYFIGGCQTSQSGSVTVCKYYPPSSNVVAVSNMAVATSQSGAAILHDMIYVVGGVSDNKAINCVQCYSPEVEAWRCVAPTKTPHCLPNVVVLYDELYVVGSYNCPLVESYDWTCDQWTEITQIPLPLTEQWPRASAHQDKLWVWRDLKEQKFLIFDPLKNEWEERDYTNGPESVYGMWSTCTSFQQLDFMLISASGLAYYTYFSKTNTWVQLPPSPAADCYYWQSVIVS